MTPTRRSLVPTLFLAAALAGTAAAATPSAPGAWRALPAAPVAPEGPPAAVWTGSRLVVVGSDIHTALDSHGQPYSIGSVDVAASYDPARRSWRKLSPPARHRRRRPARRLDRPARSRLGQFRALSYDPATDRWRRLPRRAHHARLRRLDRPRADRLGRRLLRRRVQRRLGVQTRPRTTGGGSPHSPLAGASTRSPPGPGTS